MLIPKEKIIEAIEKMGEKSAYIIAEDLQLKEFDEKNLKSLCPFHEEETPSFIWNNRDNNYFHCFGCGKKYSILDHYMQFNKLTYIEAAEKLFENAEIKFRFGEKGIKVNKDYRYPHREEEHDRKNVEEYLKLRNISKETLDYADIQEDSNKNIVFYYYDLNDVISLVKYRPARKLRNTDNKSWCQKNSDTKPLLFNMNRTDPTKPLLINEGEIDTLSVIEAGYLNCISVPFGSNNFGWIEENWDYLEQFEKIIIWSDNDGPGIMMRKECATRLGTWRTYFIDLPKKIECENGDLKPVKDANEVLYHCGKQKVLDLINNAQEIPITGVTDLAVIDDFDLENAPGLYSKLTPIDDTVYKFLFGSVILLTGIKGAGKSTLLNQIFVCESLEQGYDTFIFSAELGAPVLKSWVELTMAGPEHVTMKDQFIHIIDLESKKKMREWYSERIFVYDSMSNKEEDIIDKVIGTVRKYGIKTVILDNLMTIDIGSSENYLQMQKDFIVRLVGIAKQYGILIVLVAHPRKVAMGQNIISDDISGAAELGNLAQYIVSVHRFSKEEKEGKKDKRGNWVNKPIEHDVRIDILKNRYTGKLGRSPLFFDYTSYRFYSKPNELWKRYKWDKDNKNPIPTNDPNIHSPSPFEEDD